MIARASSLLLSRGDTHYRFAAPVGPDCDLSIFDAAELKASGRNLQADMQGRGEVTVFETAGHQLVLRHYRRGGWMRLLSHDRYLWLGLRRTRAWREFEILQHLHDAGLPCPAPFACRVQRDRCTCRASLITYRIPHATTLAERLLNGPLQKCLWYGVGGCIRRFHDSGLDHADLNASNIMIDGTGQVHLIDFDKARLRRVAGSWRCTNLRRLRRSLHRFQARSEPFYFTATDWQALLNGYRRPAAAPVLPDT